MSSTLATSSISIVGSCFTLSRRRRSSQTQSILSVQWPWLLVLSSLTRLVFFVSIDRTGKSGHVTSNETRETLAIDDYEVFPLVLSSDPSRHVLFCFLSLLASWLKRLQCKLHLQYVELEKVGPCSTSSCRLLSTGNTRWIIREMHHVLASNHNFLSQVTVSVAGFSFTLDTVSLQMT